MKNENYHRASHCKYLVQYHIILYGVQSSDVMVWIKL